MPEQSASEMVRGDFDVIMGKDHDIAGRAGKSTIVGLTKRARIVDLDDLEIAPCKERLVVRPDVPTLLLVPAADDYGNRAAVVLVGRWHCVEPLPALRRRQRHGNQGAEPL